MAKARQKAPVSAASQRRQAVRRANMGSTSAQNAVLHKKAVGYDFELFQPKKQTIQPELRVLEQRQSVQVRNFTLKVVAYIVIFFIGVTGIILNQIAITEVTKQVSDCTKQLATLQSEYRIMETQLESMTSLKNIDEVVTRELGMTKLRDDQITYVNSSEGDTLTVAEADTSTLWGKIKAGFQKMLSYLQAGSNTMEGEQPQQEASPGGGREIHQQGDPQQPSAGFQPEQPEEGQQPRPEEDLPAQGQSQSGEEGSLEEQPPADS